MIVRIFRMNNFGFKTTSPQLTLWGFLKAEVFTHYSRTLKEVRAARTYWNGDIGVVNLFNRVYREAGLSLRRYKL